MMSIEYLSRYSNLLSRTRTLLDHLGCWLYDSRKYHAPLMPYKIYKIPTTRIQKAPISTPSTETFRPSPVVGGDWDQHVRKFTDDVVYTSFDAHFNDSVEWEQTEYYQFMLDQITASGSYKGLTEKHEIRSRCEMLDELYTSIKRYGYKTQSRLDSEKVTGLDTEPHLPPERKEITVHVARDGQLLWAGGAHRLAIAKLLDIDTIPVRINIRHTQWQDTRDYVFQNRVDKPALKSHPDLQFISE